MDFLEIIKSIVRIVLWVVATFSLTNIIKRIVDTLKQRKITSGVVMPHDMMKKWIKELEKSNPVLAKRLDDAFSEDDNDKMLLMGNSTSVEAVRLHAEDASLDDFQDMTKIYANGAYRTC